jgi:phosphoribosylamine---glycine ligase
VRVLVVGAGGREHALAWALSRSPRVERLHAAPGNAGTLAVAQPVPVHATDVDGLARFAERASIDLAVVGPEAPLVAGLADRLRSDGVAVFGPGASGARVEGSKRWARDLCGRHGIPSPRTRVFTEVRPALAHLDELDPPVVVKADGLAAGKGVTVAEDRATAERAVRDCLERDAFGPAGRTVLVEEFLAGVECSALALTDGDRVVPLALAQDFKRAEDGDRGPNTGGMGAFSPLPFVGAGTATAIERLLASAVDALRDEGVDYRGVLYAGLMLTAEGPKVLEFNCRFGDPEAQVILPRLASDLLEPLAGAAVGRLDPGSVAWRAGACVGVTVAAGGYPGPVQTGAPIEGLDEAATVPGVLVFHGGTSVREGRVVTAGGRVLTVSALGDDLEGARRRAYEACSRVSFPGMRYRADIASRLPNGVAGRSQVSAR